MLREKTERVGRKGARAAPVLAARGGTAVLPYRTTLLGRAHGMIRQLVLGMLSNTWGYGGVQRASRGRGAGGGGASNPRTAGS